MRMAGIRVCFLGLLGLLAGWAAAQQATPATSVPSEEKAVPAEVSPGAQVPRSQNSMSEDQQGGFVFRRQVQEVVLRATVVDESRHLETHLDRDAFRVLQDGRPQTITSFHREDTPVAIGVLIDNSGSMLEERAEINRAVLNLIRASNPADEVFIVNFGEKAYLDQDFTSDIHLLEQALRKTSTQGSTALYDTVVASATHLKTNSRFEKRMLLVITDGDDNMSQQSLQESIRHLQDKDAPALYAIGLMGINGQSRGADALRRLATATGGSAFFPQNLDQVTKISEDLAHDIRCQYTIAYRPQDENASASYHPIEVQAQAPGYGKLTVRTRNGYYAGETVR